MEDLRIYLLNEDDRDKVQSLLMERFSEIEPDLWEPDGDSQSEGTWGIGIDQLPDEAWSVLISEFGDEQGLNGTFEMLRGDTDEEYSSAK